MRATLLIFALRAIAWYRPDGRLQIDFIPARTDDLPYPLRREHCEQVGPLDTLPYFPFVRGP
jgi:hypothetical protein